VNAEITGEIAHIDGGQPSVHSLPSHGRRVISVIRRSIKRSTAMAS
jgi:hypothetical protein